MTSNTSHPLILRGGHVFDSTSRTFRHGLDVLCIDGHIARVAPGLDASGAHELDCTGRYVLPGLIDCHVHLTFEGGPAEAETQRNLPLPARSWRAAEHARRTLNAGFTTVRDMGAADRLNIHLSNAIDSGLIPGPRMLAVGLGVTMTGGHGHGWIAREADGPDDVRRAVREQLRAGAKAIKLFASGGVMTPGVDPRSPSYTEAELAAGVEEAHKAFRVVGAHAQAVDGIKNAVRAGVDSIEHGVWLDEEAVGLMLERGTYMVATLTAPFHIAHGASAGIPPYMVDKGQQVLEDHIASFRAATRAGVNLAMGTDQGTPLSRPGENAQEILRLAEHGLSNGAAIMAATAWAADLLKVDAGRIADGLLADFAIFEDDPLTNLAALADDSRIAAVVKGGAIGRQPHHSRSEV
ncbi:MAG: amidohydrolase family protein [Dehalococcoidia bacterium]